jgi:hypothetical protein
LLEIQALIEPDLEVVVAGLANDGFLDHVVWILPDQD